MFRLIFIVIDHITSWTYLFFTHFLEYFSLFLDSNVDEEISHYFWRVTWMKKANSFQIAIVKTQGVA